MGRTSTLVVGGGCSGVLAAVALLRDGMDQVTILEPGAALGRGVAYGTAAAVHVLNSRADTMSGDPGDPHDFVEWTRQEPQPVNPDGFAGRRAYGRYLQDLMDEAAERNPGRFAHLRTQAVAVQIDDQVRVATASGRSLRADRVVLAIGHGAPTPPSQLAATLTGNPRYVADPWRPGVLETVPLDAPVLLLGTGLTAVDVALVLAARGLGAPIHAVSRHGLLPLAHTVEDRPARPTELPDRADLRTLTRRLRLAAEGREDWRGLVDAARPRVNDWWAALTVEDRRRFLRHLWRYWEVHRHRMAPSVAVLVRGMLADGALRVSAATLTDVTDDGTGLVATAASGARWRVATVINCTGPGSAARTPLGHRLLADGLARPDPLGLGLEVDAGGHLVSRSGEAQRRVVVIGPPRRGQWWETTAVPEIRAQALALRWSGASGRGAGDRAAADSGALGGRFAA
jgi:uncharacterized NAD(P)/FAD-binding protein YdhS